MMETRRDCDRFRGELSAHLEGDLAPEMSEWMASHHQLCSRCQDEFRAAIDTRALVGSWDVPSPPSAFRARLRRELTRAFGPHSITCVDFRAEVDGWRVGDLSPQRAAALAHHRDHCAPCAHEVRVADRVAALLERWVAPAAPAGLKQRILDEWVRDERRIRLARIDAATGEPAVPADRPLPRLGKTTRSTFRRSRAVATAAAVVILATLGLRAWVSSTPTEPLDRPGPELTVQELLSRYNRDVRVQAVAAEQFPGGIGRFDAQPVMADRMKRRTGNVFHQSLRAAFARAAVDHGVAR